jgi:hypothetical protein
MKQMTQIFKSSKGDSKEKLRQYHLFGMTSHEFLYSKYNPTPGKLMIRDKKSKTGWKDANHSCHSAKDKADEEKVKNRLLKEEEEKKKEEAEEKRKSLLNPYQLFKERIAEGRDFQEELGRVVMFEEENSYYMIFDALISIFKVLSSF